MEISNAKVIKSVFRNKNKIKKNEFIKKEKKSRNKSTLDFHHLRFSLSDFAIVCR